MANAAVDTGHGATLTLSTSALSFNWTSIDLGEETIDDIATSHLGSTGYKEYVPGDLKEGGSITIPFQFDNEAALPGLGTVETATVTFPLASGQTTAATLAGTGYLKRLKRPNLQTDTLQDGELVFMWDGGTGPAFTAAT